MTAFGRAGLRVLFMGTPGDLAMAPLERLLASTHHVVGVAVAGPPAAGISPELPVEPPATDPLAIAARRHGVETLWLRDTATATVERLARLRPDVIVVACLPFVLPTTLLELPPLGGLNLHPSLLPAYRGPAPLFWQLRMGEPSTGVTVHRMTGRVDGGAIVAQQTVDLPDGIGYGAATRQLAAAGALLLVQALDALHAGTLASRAQDEPQSSWFPWPSRQDFEIPSTWSARRAFNFIRGTRDWNQPFEILTPSQRIPTTDAHSFSANESPASEYVAEDGLLCLRFTPGTLRVPLPAGWDAL